MTKAVAWGQKGVGGLNLGEVGGRNRTWRHAQIFFPSANVLIISKTIKQFKSPKDQALANRRLGAARQNRGFIFHWNFLAISSARKNVAKFRVGGGG